MELIMNQEYFNETVIFDGFHFVGCSFVNCRIIITSPQFDFDRCSFIGSNFFVDPGLSVFEGSLHAASCNSGAGLLEARNGSA
jgi:hypothetical protein